jgi:hypothetical protein
MVYFILLTWFAASVGIACGANRAAAFGRVVLGVADGQGGAAARIGLGATRIDAGAIDASKSQCTFRI